MYQFYETQEEAQTRLNQSVFLYNNEPVICDGVYVNDGGGLNLSLLSLPGGAGKQVPLSDPGIELRRYNIGYINTIDGATYASRLPAKGKFKQGLCHENMIFSPLSEKRTGQKYQPKFGAMYATEPFKAMLLDVYPSMEEAVRLLKSGERPSVAFNRSLALSYDKFYGTFNLWHKGRKVAYGDQDFALPEDYSYLREVLSKHGIRIRG